MAWSKQNLGDSVQEAHNLQVRLTDQGNAYPPPVGAVAKARWVGAGFPDYPWLFATDGEYSTFAAVTAGQFTAIENHLRTLRDVSLVANGNSGKVVHEVVPDGRAAGAGRAVERRGQCHPDRQRVGRRGGHPYADGADDDGDPPPVVALTIVAVLPTGKTVKGVTLNGRRSRTRS